MYGIITGESIKSAIAQKLLSQFTRRGFTPKVYKERIVEGLHKPNFFIWTIDTAVEKGMRDNYDFTYQMKIEYQAEENRTDLYEHCCQIGLECVECLRKVNVKTVDWYVESNTRTETLKPITGRQISYQVVEGILQVFVTYRITAYIPEAEVAKMRELETNSILH